MQFNRDILKKEVSQMRFAQFVYQGDSPKQGVPVPPAYRRRRVIDSDSDDEPDGNHNNVKINGLQTSNFTNNNNDNNRNNDDIMDGWDTNDNPSRPNATTPATSSSSSRNDDMMNGWESNDNPSRIRVTKSASSSSRMQRSDIIDLIDTPGSSRSHRGLIDTPSTAGGGGFRKPMRKRIIQSDDDKSEASLHDSDEETSDDNDDKEGESDSSSSDDSSHADTRNPRRRNVKKKVQSATTYNSDDDLDMFQDYDDLDDNGVEAEDPGAMFEDIEDSEKKTMAVNVMRKCQQTTEKLQRTLKMWRGGGKISKNNEEVNTASYTSSSFRNSYTVDSVNDINAANTNDNEGIQEKPATTDTTTTTTTATTTIDSAMVTQDDDVEVVADAEAPPTEAEDCVNLTSISESFMGSSEVINGNELTELCPDLELKEYQVVGVNWLKLLHSQSLSGILADDMGLGKTIQTIAFLAYLKISRSNKSAVANPHLLVVPASTLSNWINELKRFCPSMNVMVYHGSQAERAEKAEILRYDAARGVYDIILCTYTMFERESGKEDRAVINRIRFEYLVLDEAHCIKNAKSSRFENLRRTQNKHRLLLSGTPVQNDVKELLAMLSFLMPKIFVSSDCEDLIEAFDEELKSEEATAKMIKAKADKAAEKAKEKAEKAAKIAKEKAEKAAEKARKKVAKDAAKGKGNGEVDVDQNVDNANTDTNNNNNEQDDVPSPQAKEDIDEEEVLAPKELKDNRILRQLKKMLSPFILRRLKVDVLKQLVAKTSVKIDLQMTPFQQQVYDNVISSYADLKKKRKEVEKDDVIGFDLLPDKKKKKTTGVSSADGGGGGTVDLSGGDNGDDAVDQQQALALAVAKNRNIMPDDMKRKRKSRIVMVNGNGTGYGGDVPVLADNMEEKADTPPIPDSQSLSLSLTTTASSQRNDDDDDDEKQLSATDAKHLFTALRKAANHPLLLRVRFKKADDLDLIAKVACINQHFGASATLDRIREELELMSDLDLHYLCSEYRDLQHLTLGSEVLYDSPKMRHLKKILPELLTEGHRVLIFSQWTRLLDLLEVLLNDLGLNFLRLDGSTAVRERQGLIDTFSSPQASDPTSPSFIGIFLLSTKAGGLGINLTAADTVIMHDLDFNPVNDRQAEDRCHRIGQTKPVTVYKMVTVHSVDESIFAIGQRKTELTKAILKSDPDAGDNHGTDNAANGGYTDALDIGSIIKNVVGQHRFRR